MTAQEQMRDYLININKTFTEVTVDIKYLLDRPEDITFDDIKKIHDVLTKMNFFVFC